VSSISPACRPEADISFFTRTLLAAYFIEAGLILIVAPWSGFWGRNVLVEYLPALQPVLASPFFRGGVSGVGLVTVVAGIAELSGLLMKRGQGGVRSPDPGEPVP
jgi:hypothetical protein